MLGTGLLLVLQAVVSIAIIRYFQKNGGGNVFSTMIAPAISFVVQLVLVWMLISNLSTLGGQTWLIWTGAAVILIGLIWGFALKSMNPTGYNNIGRMVNEG